MGAGASTKDSVHEASKDELVAALSELTQEQRDMIGEVLDAAEKPHTDYGWADMMHRWDGDGHAHPEIEEEAEAPHDDDHWTIMDTFKLQKLFESIDEDGDGKVCRTEWEAAHKAYSKELRATFGHTVDDIEKLFTTIDTDGDGTLSWEEFRMAAPTGSVS